MCLVGSKPVRSNVTIPTKSFSRVFFFHKFRNLPCIMMSSIIPLPHQFSIFEDMLTALILGGCLQEVQLLYCTFIVTSPLPHI